MADYRDKRCYIFGGSSGIGLAVACQLAARGARVAVFARDPDRLARAAAEISSVGGSGGEPATFSLDVAEPGKVAVTCAQAVSCFGPPDLVVNSAGRAYPRRFEDITWTQFDETMRINLYGLWHTTAALLPHLPAPGGTIVNIASIAGLVGVFGYTDYAASKFAVVGFTEALRSELAPRGIRVAVLCPPDTDTPSLAVENRTKPAETRAISAHARVMSAEAVARALLRGLEKGRFLIIPGFDGKLTCLAQRLAPGLVRRLMDRDVRRMQRRGD